MLTPDQLAHIADSMVEMYSQLNETIIRDVARRIAKTATVTETGKLQLMRRKNMTQAQRTQRIYALGSRLGLLENGNKDDLLHNLVIRLTGKSHISSLTEAEYKTVITLYLQSLLMSQFLRS